MIANWLITTVKSIIKRTLETVGLTKSKSSPPALNQVREQDIFLISFPKSGNTWIRFLLANLMESHREITLKNINEFVPGIYQFKNEIDLIPGQRYIKSHHFHENINERVIYVYRDYRDVLISYFHYLSGHGQFKGTLSEFVKSDQKDQPFGSWKDHLTEAITYQSTNPSKMLMVSFDQLKGDPISQLKRIISFCKIIPEQPLEQIIEKCSFNNLRQVEAKYGKVHDKSEINFFRSGKSEQWKTELTQEDLDYIMTDEVLSVFNALKIKL